ncbi:MAG: MogA/MoaB family molybdenum cofactor biosynthesis protein [Streptosporangiaceae bacterium]
MTVKALAVTISTRAASGVYEDRSGPVLAELLSEYGCQVRGPVVVPDGAAVRSVLEQAVAEGYDVVVTSGGTGLTPTDQTPEMTRLVITREVPGIADAIRLGNRDTVPTSILSRGLAGIAGNTLIVNLPGSTGGVRDGMQILGPVLAHAVDQISGGDHPRPADGA